MGYIAHKASEALIAFAGKQSQANLVFNLTPGAVKFANINGKFNIVRPFEQIHEAEISRVPSR